MERTIPLVNSSRLRRALLCATILGVVASAPLLILPGTLLYFDTTPNNQLGSLDSACNADPWKASSFHTAGVNVAYADGSVHFIFNAIDLATFQALSTIDGHEQIVAPSD